MEMDDPRNQSYMTYTQANLGYMAILKNVCGQYSMREMEENFNKETCIATLRIMSGNQKLNEMPHFISERGIVRTAFAQPGRRMMERR